MLAGQPCGLVASADVIVHALAGRRGQAVLERLGQAEETAPEVLVLTGRHAAASACGRESLPSATPGPELLAAVYRLHGRRVRFIRLAVTLHDGRRVTVRAMRPHDVDRLREFDAGLSPRSRQFRYLGSKPPMTQEDWAKQLATVDFDRRFALVATAGKGAAERIVADCRLVANEENRAELAIVVADDHQGAGLGRLLVELTLKVATDRGLREVFGDVRFDNRVMALLLRSEGFERVGWDVGVMTFVRSPA